VSQTTILILGIVVSLLRFSAAIIDLKTNRIYKKHHIKKKLKTSMEKEKNV
jgi:hypothetical protein